MADIGTDHAQLPVALVYEQAVPRAIAIDNRPGPLMGARTTIANAGVQATVEIRLGNGLQPLQAHEVDTVVVAGMGGMKMTSLVDNWAHTPLLPRLILQPNTGWSDVRRWVAQRQFGLLHETLVAAAGHYYVTLVVDPRADVRHDWESDPDALLLGPLLRTVRPEIWYAWIDAERRRLAQAQTLAAGNSTSLLESRLATLERYGRR